MPGVQRFSAWHSTAHGQKLAGIGFRFDIHDALFIQYPVTQINRIGDFNVTNRVIFSLKDNVQQTDECRASCLTDIRIS